MVIRIKGGCFLKPRRCPQCHKICLFARAPKAKCCPKCHKEQRRMSRLAERRRKRREGIYKYTAQYHRIRKNMIAEQPYCSLCGDTENLTVHHVGGGREHYTVLCDSCHQAYERFNHKRKVKKCIRRNGIKRNINAIRSALVGMKLRTSIRTLDAKSWSEKSTS